MIDIKPITQTPVSKPTPTPPITTNRKTNDTKPPPPSGVPPIQLTTPQVPKEVSLPTPSPDKPKTNILSPYTDPLEQSLASLEHDIKPEPLEGLMSNPPISTPLQQPPPNPTPPVLQDVKTTLPMDLGGMLQQPPMVMQQQQQQQHHLHHRMHQDSEAVVAPSVLIHATNNGFGGLKHEFDVIPTNNNGMSSMGGVPMNVSIPSMFDPLPQQQINMAASVKKEPLLLSGVKGEDYGSGGDVKQAIQGQVMAEHTKQHPHSHTFHYKTNKQEHNVKNASSWSSLAKANSPQNTTPGGSSRQQVMESFKAFQNKAKEKADREKQRLENLELKRQQKQQAEKERLRVENERRKEREEEDALEKARFLFFDFFGFWFFDYLILQKSRG